MAEQMEKYEEVYWKTIEYAKETAREAGLKEGQVLAFLKMNLPITEIMKHTGLSEEEIQKIKTRIFMKFHNFFFKKTQFFGNNWTKK